MADPTIFIDVDKAKMSQVLRNVMSNALKFSPPKSTIKIRVSVMRGPMGDDAAGLAERDEAVGSFFRMTVPLDGDARNSYFRVEIEDRGVGLQEVEASRLFGEMVQFDAGKLQAGGGSGIGLYLSKGLMDLHNGRIGVTTINISVAITLCQRS